MNITKTIFAAGAIALLPFAASAATLSAVQGFQSDGSAVAADRSDINNAQDGDPTTFFSLGIGGTLTADVSPLFVGSGSVVEVTFGNNTSFPESALVLLGGTVLGELFNTASGAATTSTGVGGSSVSFVSNTLSGFTSFLIDVGSNFGSMLTLEDTTLVNFNLEYAASGIISDGFDVGEFNVTPVPVPAAGLLLLGGLGGLAAMKRRKKA